MPDDIRYSNIGSRGSSMMESPMVTVTLNGGQVQPLDDMQEEKTKICNQSGGSDMGNHHQDSKYTRTTSQQRLESLKRSCSDDSLSSPASASSTSVESDAMPTNDLDDLTNYTSPEEGQEMNPVLQALATKDTLPNLSTNDGCHQIDQSSDTGDASENDGSILDDSSRIVSDRVSISRPLQDAFSSERQLPIQSPITPTHNFSPAIKISLDERIPIRLNGPWRGMKRPDVANRIVEEFPHANTVHLSPIPPLCIRRTPYTTVSSCCCSDHTTHPKRRKDQVRFDSVHRRFFHQTIGDNPSVPIGTPITLDWTYEEDEGRIPIDEFEQSRMVSRKKGNNRLIMHRLTLSYYQRRNILSYYAGCTEEQLNEAERDVARARRQRQITAFFSDLWRVEDFVTSLGRKTKRLFQRRRRIGS